ALERECLEGKPGCDVIAIPHNSNVSNGLMWTTTRGDGGPITAADARRRMRLERLVEITQHKGDSECRAGVVPGIGAGIGAGIEDELCSFETVAYARMQDMARVPEDSTIPPLVYVREVLGEGLVQGEHALRRAGLSRSPGFQSRRSGRRLGRGEQPALALCGDEAARDLRDQRAAHAGSLLRGLGVPERSLQ
ncbi:MAG: DUF3604 domain-containing protein, partial [Deltaproteobacteria bacterium]|nr:DUF3604 domain-containing protein [Deltaproteobacteria bacterium]